MAGDWIKLEFVTPEKPEVYEIAGNLGVTPNEVIGGLVRMWIWANAHSENGDALSVTKRALDSVAHLDGLADAMLRVGWLREKNGRFSVPHFERHNTESAKKRAQTAKRMKRLRYAGSVTKASPEKRREEKRNTPPPSPAKPVPGAGGGGGLAAPTGAAEGKETVRHLVAKYGVSKRKAVELVASIEGITPAVVDECVKRANPKQPGGVVLAVEDGAAFAIEEARGRRELAQRNIERLRAQSEAEQREREQRRAAREAKA